MSSLLKIWLAAVAIGALVILLHLDEHFIWALLFSVPIIGFFSILVDYVSRVASGEVLGRSFLYLMITATFLSLGFIVNGLKGLLLMQMNFLEFKNGKFVVRTDFSNIPDYDVVMVLKELLLLAVAILGLFLLSYKWLARKLTQGKQSAV